MNNLISNFSELALTRLDMKNVKGGINYDCYCVGGGAAGFGFTAPDREAAMLKVAMVGSKVCGSSSITCGIVTTKKKIVYVKSILELDFIYSSKIS